MAIQNLVSGGYRGKLGDTIGQAWKNKRVIKSYAVPSNPRTEKQQANRARFAQAVKLSQLALSINKGVPMWKSSEKTDYNMRMSQAKKNIDEGLVGWQATPLYPSGTTPTATLLNIFIRKEGVDRYILSSETVTALTIPRDFCFVIQVKEISTGDTTDLYFSVIVDPLSADFATIIIPAEYELLEESQIIGITTDDINHNGTFASIPPQMLQKVQKITVDDCVFSWTEQGKLLVTSQKMAQVQDPLSIQLIANFADLYTGESSTDSYYANYAGSSTIIGNYDIAQEDLLPANTAIQLIAYKEGEIFEDVEFIINPVTIPNKSVALDYPNIYVKATATEVQTASFEQVTEFTRNIQFTNITSDQNFKTLDWIDIPFTDMSKTYNPVVLSNGKITVNVSSSVQFYSLLKETADIYIMATVDGADITMKFESVVNPYPNNFIKVPVTAIQQTTAGFRVDLAGYIASPSLDYPVGFRGANFINYCGQTVDLSYFDEVYPLLNARNETSFGVPLLYTKEPTTMIFDYNQGTAEERRYYIMENISIPVQTTTMTALCSLVDDYQTCYYVTVEEGGGLDHLLLKFSENTMLPINGRAYGDLTYTSDVQSTPKTVTLDSGWTTEVLAYETSIDTSETLRGDEYSITGNMSLTLEFSEGGITKRVEGGRFDLGSL